MVVGAKVCDLTEDLLWFVCDLYVGILTSPLKAPVYFFMNVSITLRVLMDLIDSQCIWL